MASSALCCAVLYPRPHPTISQVDTTYVLHYVKLSYQIITNISTQMEGWTWKKNEREKFLEYRSQKSPSQPTVIITISNGIKETFSAVSSSLRLESNYFSLTVTQSSRLKYMDGCNMSCLSFYIKLLFHPNHGDCPSKWVHWYCDKSRKLALFVSKKKCFQWKSSITFVNVILGPGWY